MNSRSRVLSVGFVWGWLEASLLFLIAITSVGTADSFLDFGRGWSASLAIAIPLSLIAGLILADFGDLLKALVLSIFVGFVWAIVVVTTLAVPISVSPDQGDAEVTYFVLLAPLQFFVGLVIGGIGSLISNRFADERTRRNIRPFQH